MQATRPFLYNIYMGLSDDDDFLPEADRDYSKADLGQADALKQEIERTLGEQKATKVQAAELKSKSDLQQLQHDLAGKADEETRRKQEAEEKAKEKSSAPKTKSLKEREDDIVEGAHDTVTPDQLIERQERETEVSDEESQAQPG